MRLQTLSSINNVYRDVLHGHNLVLPDPPSNVHGAVHLDSHYASIHSTKNSGGTRHQEPGKDTGKGETLSFDIDQTGGQNQIFRQEKYEQ